MSISSVGQYPFAGVVMDPPASKGHHGSRCGCEGAAAPEPVEVREVSTERADRHHHGHGKGHDHHGNGFGFGHFARGMGHFIQEQLGAARREVAGEQIAEAVTGLQVEVAGVIEASGRQDGLAVAQEDFNAAIQDVVERFNSGEIGRRRTMAEFHDAFERLVEAAGSAPADDLTAPGVDAAGVAGTPEPAIDDAESAAAGDGSLAQNLGQVFSDFMQGLRTEFSAAAGMREFMSPENRTRILETFVELYRELAAPDKGEGGEVVASGAVDQLA